MSFFAKIKQFFGAGTVKVTLNAPATFNTNDGVIEGSVHLEAKSDQTILSLKIELKEEYTTGRGDEKKTKTFEIGEVKLEGFDMKQGETKDVPFKLSYSYAKSDNEAMAEKGGVMGGLGKLGSFASGEKSEFKLWATADVKGAALDPNDLKELKRVK
jgi:hypothetical protein